MDQCTKVGGKTTKQMEKEDLYMLMAISMMDIGRMIKPMVMEYIVTWTELDMKVIGKKINNMEKDLKHGLMEPAIEETMLKVKNTGQVVSLGLMEVLILVNSMIITLKESEFINGQTEENMMVNGKTTKWKVLVFSHGLMVENTKDSI